MKTNDTWALIVGGAIVAAAYILANYSADRYTMVRVGPAVVRLDKSSGEITLWRLKADGGIEQEDVGDRDPAVLNALKVANISE